MSASLSHSDSAEWNYRITSQRLIIIENKSVETNKIAVLDELLNLTFTVEVKEKNVLERLELSKEYMATLKVYTASNIAGVEKEFTNFFKALDIDQTIEDFIKAFWIYPTKIRFELAEIEEP